MKQAGPEEIQAGSSGIKTDTAELDAMLRRLLADRFHLAVHTEIRTLPALVLVVGEKPEAGTR